MTDKQLKSLASVARVLCDKYKEELKCKKEKGFALKERPDFLWYELLASYSSWGGLRGDLIKDQKKYQQVTYEELKKLGNKEARANRLQQIMQEAKVHWYNRKAQMLAQCFEKIEAMGGLIAANEALLSKKSSEEMMKFLDDFPGIGLKYARNIMMDSYHPYFHNHIAIDARIKSVSKQLGLDFPNYCEHEKFYLSAAKEAGIEGWELDRLIWGHQDEFLCLLRYPKNEVIV